MRTHLEFVSTSLSALPEEEDEVNPGLGGKQLAQFLASELPRHDFVVTGINPEDWGWRIDLEHPDFPLWIGCGTYAEYRNGFLCFIEPSEPFVRRWLRKIPTAPVVERLAATLEIIIARSGKANQMRWWTEDEANR